MGKSTRHLNLNQASKLPPENKFMFGDNAITTFKDGVSHHDLDDIGGSGDDPEPRGIRR
jgi:hypothetical protein